MLAKLVRYRIRPEETEVVESAIRQFVSAIAEHEPRTKYATYRTASGTSYAHVMSFPDAAAEEKHRNAPYTTAFVDVVYARCNAGPTVTDLTPLAGAGD
jgi:quinol monooxygenase YgiN